MGIRESHNNLSHEPSGLEAGFACPNRQSEKFGIWKLIHESNKIRVMFLRKFVLIRNLGPTYNTVLPLHDWHFYNDRLPILRDWNSYDDCVLFPTYRHFYTGSILYSTHRNVYADSVSKSTYRHFYRDSVLNSMYKNFYVDVVLYSTCQNSYDVSVPNLRIGTSTTFRYWNLRIEIST